MVHRMAPRRTGRFSGMSALLLAVGVSTSPALAATSADSRCDQSAESPALPDVRPGDLSLEVVDHSVTPGQTSVDSAIEPGGSSNAPANERPRVETLLRRIFDEPQLRAPEVPETEEADTRSAPFAVDKPENAEKPTTTVPGDKDSEPSPHLPGVSSDDVLRFKRQMYRTDI
jgi:hypothetical protein